MFFESHSKVIKRGQFLLVLGLVVDKRILTYVFFALTGCLALWQKVSRQGWKMCVMSSQSTTPFSLATK